MVGRRRPAAGAPQDDPAAGDQGGDEEPAPDACADYDRTLYCVDGDDFCDEGDGCCSRDADNHDGGPCDGESAPSDSGDQGGQADAGDWCDTEYDWSQYCVDGDEWCDEGDGCCDYDEDCWDDAGDPADD